MFTKIKNMIKKEIGFIDTASANHDSFPHHHIFSGLKSNKADVNLLHSILLLEHVDDIFLWTKTNSP